eukprot:s1110_g6.t1
MFAQEGLLDDDAMSGEVIGRLAEAKGDSPEVAEPAEAYSPTTPLEHLDRIVEEDEDFDMDLGGQPQQHGQAQVQPEQEAQPMLEDPPLPAPSEASTVEPSAADAGPSVPPSVAPSLPASGPRSDEAPDGVLGFGPVRVALPGPVMPYPCPPQGAPALRRNTRCPAIRYTRTGSSKEEDRRRCSFAPQNISSAASRAGFNRAMPAVAITTGAVLGKLLRRRKTSVFPLKVDSNATMKAKLVRRSCLEAVDFGSLLADLGLCVLRAQLECRRFSEVPRVCTSSMPPIVRKVPRVCQSCMLPILPKVILFCSKKQASIPSPCQNMLMTPLTRCSFVVVLRCEEREKREERADALKATDAPFRPMSWSRRLKALDSDSQLYGPQSPGGPPGVSNFISNSWWPLLCSLIAASCALRSWLRPTVVKALRLAGFGRQPSTTTLMSSLASTMGSEGKLETDRYGVPQFAGEVELLEEYVDRAWDLFYGPHSIFVHS